jgi:hypothetical protein
MPAKMRRICVIPAIMLLIGGCSQTSRSGFPLDQPIRSSVWRFGQIEGNTLATAHYEVHTNCADFRLGNGLAGFMEAARSNYLRLTGLPAPTLGGKWQVYLLAGRGDWEAVTNVITGPMAPTYTRVANGGYCHHGQCVFWDMGPVLTYATASHEGLHQFLHFATRQSLPTWAEEGLATQAEGYTIEQRIVYFDPARNLPRERTLASCIRGGRLRSVKTLLSMTAKENLMTGGFHGGEYYSELWAMLLLIRSEPHYREGFERMVADAAAGKLGQSLGITGKPWIRLLADAELYNDVLGPKTFAHYIEPDLAAFEQRYQSFARDLAGTAAPTRHGER